MSLIFPKKQPLYAPMLGTLGGGSARGMGRGLGRGIGLFRILMIGGGGGKNTQHNGTGGAGGLALFELELPFGTQFTSTAGGAASDGSKFGGGGGHSRLQIPSINFDAVVGGGGGAGYMDMGGLGGGVGINGTHGYDYPGGSTSSSGGMQDQGYGSGYGGSQTSGGGGGTGGGTTGVSGGQFYGGVYQYPGDTYPAGNGGSGYYGGGSGGGNNGAGGGPGGGGSGYISLGNATGYNLLLNSAHQTLNINMFSVDARYHYQQNISMQVQYGTVNYEFPPNYTNSSSAHYYHLSHWHDQISSTDSSFANYRTYGGGGRDSRGSQTQPGVVVIHLDGAQQHVNVGTTNTANSSTNGNVVVTTTL